ncbi:hypothetical protein [Desulforhabdus sp. TSK]|uniref:hypothetical protein n=1 Tax=Desulforhabdus sp. TSK TaxID=2925014 RepID=UPI001FC80471|nr:hypothetical protein [Desulforhabdus sp. TSK]GKT10299.1 hypothetical protein DSTSK_36040 [Desulforhabdus sp. TSK]
MFHLGSYARHFLGFVLICFFALMLGQFYAVQAFGAAGFEVPVNEQASDILPKELLAGKDYRINNTVISYGYMHTYRVDSDFAPFEVTGGIALRKLLREIWAIGIMQETRKSEAYLKGLKNAASQPIEFGANLITDPVDTITGVPRGVARLFENVKTGLTTKSAPGEDSKVKQALAVSSNKRELAAQLGVDVYSSNTALQKELNSLAWATAIGSLSLSAALAPVGGAAAATVSATRVSQQLNDVLREYPPQRLRQMNDDKLRAMGIPSDLVTRFLDHPSYTPTQETVIVQSLASLSGAKRREVLLKLALSADDEESANFFMNTAETLGGYQSKVAPIKDLSVYGPLVFAKAANDTVLIPLPLDHGIWTEMASRRVPMAMAAFKGANPGSQKFEAWVTGTVSELAKEEMAKLGIQVVEKVVNRIEFVY